MKLGILNDLNGNYKKYINACEDLGIDYEVIDFVSNEWVNNLKNSNCDGFLVRPQVNKQVYKDMFDERLYFIEYILGYTIFPSFKECFIYEDKKRMAYWLETNNIKHAKTWVFYDLKEAEHFIKQAQFPLVFKTNNGSGAIGVEYVNNTKEARRLLKRIFSTSRIGNRGFIKWKKSGLGLKYPLLDDRQHNFVIFQEKLDVDVEWRMIRIGDSYFGHKKISDGQFHSGSLKVEWGKPPEELLNLLKDITDKGNFRSMGVDIFKTHDNQYYVNELQTIFGSYDNSQMYIDNTPGRYRYDDGEWVFEEGYFNTNSSFDLRVKTLVEMLENTQFADE